MRGSLGRASYVDHVGQLRVCACVWYVVCACGIRRYCGGQKLYQMSERVHRAGTAPCDVHTCMCLEACACVQHRGITSRDESPRMKVRLKPAWVADGRRGGGGLLRGARADPPRRPGLPRPVREEGRGRGGGRAAARWSAAGRHLASAHTTGKTAAPRARAAVPHCELRESQRRQRRVM